MDEAVFRKIVEEAWSKVPPQYREQIANVAVLVEDEPSEEVRQLEGLTGEDTLLGLYLGVPQTERGEGYGVGITLPDTITVYRLPTMREAEDVAAEEGIDLAEAVSKVVRDTIWHEVGHYFGHDDEHIEGREAEGSNKYRPE